MVIRLLKFPTTRYGSKIVGNQTGKDTVVVTINRFNPETRIRFALPHTVSVKLEIYNMMGQRVRTLVSHTHAPGTYEATWDARDDTGQLVSTGVYFYFLRAGEFTARRKLMLMK
ncbi:MAG: T9SS C-terminal target domain-containing protein [Calditrichaeota bacterium]|nr:MAG: T9SS C-terminal target domain-containing protein [Calditrichota bacterium]